MGPIVLTGTEIHAQSKTTTTTIHAPAMIENPKPKPTRQELRAYQRKLNKRLLRYSKQNK